MTPAILDPAETLAGTFYPALPLDRLEPSPRNPRRHQAPDGDAELAESIRAVGILEPLIARPRGLQADGGFGYEVVAGHRRLTAARLAGVTTAPVIVRDLTDAAALEIAVIENNQRKDVHPLDEAEAFRRLADETGASSAEIAAKIGRSVRYVGERLRLLTLHPEVLQAFEADRITLGHAQLLTRVPVHQQPEGLKACFTEVFAFDGTENRREALQPVHELQQWIADDVRLDPTSEAAQEEFPELVAEVAQAEAAGATVLMLSDEWYRYITTKPGDPVLRSKWEESKAKDAVLGVIVEGRRRGKTLRVVLKAEPKAPVREKPAPKTAAQKEADRKAKEDEQRRRQAEEAKRARARTVTTRAVEQLARTPVTSLQLAGPLRVVMEGLVGTDSFDPDVLAAAARQIGVSMDVFRFGGAKARLKLPAGKLAACVAVLAVGANYYSDNNLADAFDAFGVDLKALDKAVAKEQAAKAKSESVPSAKAGSAKKATKAGKAAKRR